MVITRSQTRAAACVLALASGALQPASAGAANYAYAPAPSYGTQPYGEGREPGSRLASLIAEARFALEQGRVVTAWRIADEADALVPHSLDVRRLRADIERYERTSLRLPPVR